MKRLLLIIVVILLAGCASPTPVQIVSPLATPSKVFLPVVVSRWPTKKCVALSSGADLQKMHNLGASCTYVYSEGGRVGSDLNGIEINGMAVYSHAPQKITGGDHWLGFNEPDLQGVTPQMAAQVWPAWEGLNADKQAVSPAPSHVHPEWLEQFYSAYLQAWGRPPKLAALATHCYSSADFCINSVSRVISDAIAWNVPEVWITEFAFTNAWSYPAGTTWQSEAQKFIDWMQSQPKITRFYWWAMTYNGTDPAEWWAYGWKTQLYDWDTGQLNERGIFYQSIR